MEVTSKPHVTFTDTAITLSWWTDDRTPAPKRGGSFLYCPHATVERVKVPKKRALQEVVKHCPFRTRNARKYRRHYIRNHGELTS